MARGVTSPAAAENAESGRGPRPEGPGKSLAAHLAAWRGGDLWVFAYGSLMWDPAFEHAERAPALLRGYHRALCLWSRRYRGTPERPGLVLGLDRGGACPGFAYRVPAASVPLALASLWAREMVSGCYVPREVPMRLGGAMVPALAFVADRRHADYAGRLPWLAVMCRLAAAAGERGTNVDYVARTCAQLRSAGVFDRRLHACARAAEALLAARTAAEPTRRGPAEARSI